MICHLLLHVCAYLVPNSLNNVHYLSTLNNGILYTIWTQKQVSPGETGDGLSEETQDVPVKWKVKAHRSELCCVLRARACAHLQGRQAGAEELIQKEPQKAGTCLPGAGSWRSTLHIHFIPRAVQVVYPESSCMSGAAGHPLN